MQREDWMPSATCVDVICAWCAAALFIVPVGLVL
jgi:hypothetical protein